MSTNKKNHKRNSLLNEEEVDFPVSFDLKVFLDGTVPDDENKTEVAKRLYELEIPFSHWEKRLSKKGNYVCFTVSVTVDDDDTFQSLYEELESIPGLKLAI
jgi:putative lipoic acid-binding regulatory protein